MYVGYCTIRSHLNKLHQNKHCNKIFILSVVSSSHPPILANSIIFHRVTTLFSWHCQKPSIYGYPNCNPHIRTYRGILRMYLWYYRGKFGGCGQIPTQKNMLGSKLCGHDRGIGAKCADIWLSWRHVANTSATFSAKPPTCPHSNTPPTASSN